MSIDGRHELRNFAQSLIGAYILSTDGAARASPEALTEQAKVFLASERCASLIDQFMRSLLRVLAVEMMQERRSDAFRRLLCHPLTDLLDQGLLSRSLLDNYFHFLHLVLGDKLDELTALCQKLIDEIKADPHFSWDMFYQDERAKLLLWTVLMRILDTFKRFDPRRDWFIALMQNRPHAVSLGAHAFVPLTRNEESDQAPFGPTEFNLLFNALFRPLLQLGHDDNAVFAKQFGGQPAQLVSPLVEKLV